MENVVASNYASAVHNREYFENKQYKCPDKCAFNRPDQRSERVTRYNGNPPGMCRRERNSDATVRKPNKPISCKPKRKQKPSPGYYAINAIYTSPMISMESPLRSSLVPSLYSLLNQLFSSSSNWYGSPHSTSLPWSMTATLSKSSMVSSLWATAMMVCEANFERRSRWT